MEIWTKRVYQTPKPQDGYRILVDRVWPRGMTKQQVCADLWLKEVAPTTALRKWFGHDRSKWGRFKHRYYLELDAMPEVVEQFFINEASGRLTLLYSAQDVECNQAVALKEYLLSRIRKSVYINRLPL